MAVKVRCVVPDCPSKALPVENWGNMFSFPKTDQRRQQWFQNLNLIELSVYTAEQLRNKGYRVCHRHFNEIQFQNEKKDRLNFNVIPPAISETIASECAVTSTRYTNFSITSTERRSTHSMLEGNDKRCLSPGPSVDNENIGFSECTVTTTPASVSLQINEKGIRGHSMLEGSYSNEAICETPRKRRKIPENEDCVNNSQREDYSFTLKDINATRTSQLSPRK